MRVLLNGEETELETGATVDAEVVPRGEWRAHELSEGARIEVLRAIQGG